MLFDNETPRYLPHLTHPEVLQMGLTPLGESRWIETDNHLSRYHRHKLRTREQLGERAYRAAPGSLPAQRELLSRLLKHLTRDQAEHYRLAGRELHCGPGDFVIAVESDEALWTCSLWIADDLVIMEELDGEYCLTAASLCSPSHWRLEEKFECPMRAIHDPIPGFHHELSPKIDRFFRHLRTEHPVVRFNWSLQAYDDLCQRPERGTPVDGSSRLYYRTERQCLTRLPTTGAIAFTIRVYLHPLEMLRSVPGAIKALFAAIDDTPPELAAYKGFDELGPALASYRDTRATG